MSSNNNLFAESMDALFNEFCSGEAEPEVYGPALPEHGEVVTADLCRAIAKYEAANGAADLVEYWTRTAKIVEDDQALLALRAANPGDEQLEAACRSILR